MNRSATPTVSNWSQYEEVVIRVEQGPRWFAELLYDPPLWAQRLLPLLVGIVGACLLFALYRVGLPREAKMDMLSNCLVAGSIGLATFLLVEVAPLPYRVDVLGGVAIGYLVAHYVEPFAIGLLWPETAG